MACDKGRVSPGAPSKMKVWWKKQMNRFHRRLAKRDPENAPQKRGYSGYD